MSLFQPDTNYIITENTLSQTAIQFPDALDNTVDKIISIASTGISLKWDILTTAVETIISPLDITDVTTGNVITMARLTYLPIGLAALTVPSNTTTCNFNDAIQVQDYNTTLAPPLVHSEAKLGANPLGVYGLQFTSTEIIATTISNDNGNDMNITADGNLTITADDNITLTSGGLSNINLDAYNVNSFNFAMPICFTRERSDTFAYTFAGQTWELVYTTSVAVPSQLFSDNTNPYTSSYWKIDFALNCFNNSSIGDKGLAMYIEFEDQALATYLPNAYNLNTPYAVYQTSSLFTNAPQPPFQNFNWSDVIDFSGLVNSGSGNVPLNMKLWVAGDSAFTCNFQMVMTLTRTNLV